MFSTSGFKSIVLILAVGLIAGCDQFVKEKNNDVALTEVVEDFKETKVIKLSDEFKEYWYAGDAELTSYKLNQARYGELREGTSVLIYVTEPFLADKQVKADKSAASNIPVLKLNSTKKYLTGIYPYSIMTSIFYPVSNDQHAIKVSNSVQEWCGHVYVQLNNRKKYEIDAHSYFESEADQKLRLDKNYLEDEIWTKIRIDPNTLPTGNIDMIPSMEYIRLGHKEIKAYKATASSSNANGVITYTITYPELNRTLSIDYSESFPYTIEGWKDEFKSGFGSNATMLISEAIKMKKLKIPYWQKNGNKDLILRDSLGL